ncbi:transcriptional regulator [Hyphomonas sp. CACIAM 19H1]|uniref:helix-turn-helix domain-containing protein n=1 Tax=Hyphomonas sp. CACIAM 19H1 TaxID=1873716 RepID=UPI000DEDFD4E|nr:helix-turn-helix transcriptional regulator [Hyphomonas sp. CACIAM 19H1]AXE63609.1 transcriptional regulator [Hyphomonas sp. CACIAM 19H1]
MEIRAIFAENLKKHRKAAGLSQEELAHIAEIERGYVSQLERRLNAPTIDMLAKLANAIGVEPYELLKPGQRIRKK